MGALVVAVVLALVALGGLLRLVLDRTLGFAELLSTLVVAGAASYGMVAAFGRAWRSDGPWQALARLVGGAWPRGVRTVIALRAAGVLMLAAPLGLILLFLPTWQLSEPWLKALYGLSLVVAVAQALRVGARAFRVPVPPVASERPTGLALQYEKGTVHLPWSVVKGLVRLSAPGFAPVFGVQFALDASENGDLGARFQSVLGDEMARSVLDASAQAYGWSVVLGCGDEAQGAALEAAVNDRQ